MGNAVPCGMDVEQQQEVQRIQRRRSSRARLESSCSSSLSSLQPSESPQESPEVSAEMIPKPLSSVFIQNAQEPTKGSRGAAQGHHRSSRRLSGTHVHKSSKLPNSPQYNTATDDAGVAADGAQSNELSFSVPEIDSHPSSSGTLEHDSPTAASYSFGSHDADEVTDYAFADRSDQFDDRFSPGPAASGSAVARKETPAVPESAFVAWEMGFGIISGAHRVSPISSPTGTNKKSSVTEKPSSTPTALAAVAAPLAASSIASGKTTAATSTGMSSTTGTEQASKQKSATTPTSPRLSSAGKKQQPIMSSTTTTPSLHAPTPLSTTTKTSAQTAPPQQQRRLSGMPQLRSAPNAQRMKSTTDSDKSQLARRKLAAVHAAARGASPSPPTKKVNPLLQPDKTSLGLSGQMDHFELYDLNFINAGAPLTAASITAETVTPPKTKTAAPIKSEAALSSLASPPGILSTSNRTKTSGHSPPPSISPPTVKDAAKAGNSKASPTFSNLLSPAELSANAAKKQGNPSPSSSTKATPGGNKAAGDGKSPAGSGAAAAAHRSFPKQPDSSEPGSSALPLLRHTPKAANGTPAASSSSPTLPRNSTAETGSKSAKGVQLPSTSSLSASAAAAAAARGENAMDGPINVQGKRSPEKPRRRNRSSQHRRHKHRRRSSRRNTLYGGGDDEEGNTGRGSREEDESGSTSATDDSSGLDELEESAPNLRASQKVDSILVRSGSFKSRGGGSVGPQDLTTATGSVSFLLCEKEAELAMASSQFMSKAVPRRRKERLRRMNEDFGMGVLSDIEGDAEEAAAVEDGVTQTS